MARPRTVQARVLEIFMEHPYESFSVLNLAKMLTSYNASQISHSLSLLLRSEEILRDGKRRPVDSANGSLKRIQFYRLAPDRRDNVTGACHALGLDPKSIERAPFQLTNRLVTFFLVQQALLGSERGARFAQARAQRYGNSGMPHLDTGTRPKATSSPSRQVDICKF